MEKNELSIKNSTFSSKKIKNSTFPWRKPIPAKARRVTSVAATTLLQGQQYHWFVKTSFSAN